MRVVLQRVKRAEVWIEGKRMASIGEGVLLFLGIHREDTEKDLEYLVKKITTLRIKEDENGKTNLSLDYKEDEILLVSQFTLYGDCRKGRRPSFSSSAPADVGKKWYLSFKSSLEEMGFSVQTGQFGAHMEIKLVNDGPFTLLIDSRNQITF